MNKKSIVSGILVGIGVMINSLSGNKYIGAALFSFALLAIIQNGIPLYTGRIGFVDKYKPLELFQYLVFNLFGVIIPVIFTVFCNQDLIEIIQAASITKFSHSLGQMFLLGFMCGILMLIAVYSKKEIITIFCIMIFILSGYEHCIADFPYLILNFSWMNFVKFIFIVLGNSVGSIFTYVLLEERNGKNKRNTVPIL